MPLSEATVEAFAPRLQALVDNIHQVDSARHQHKGGDSSALEKSEQLSLSAESEQTLKEAMDFLTWTLGEILGIAKEHRQFLRWEDLSLSEIQEMLLTHVPGPLTAACLQLVRDIRARKVLHVLAAPFLKKSQSEVIKPAPFKGRLAAIVRTRKGSFESGFQSGGWYSPTHEVNFDEVSKIRVLPGQETFPLHGGTYSGEERVPNVMYLEGCKVEDRYGQDHLSGKTPFRHKLLYKTEVKLSGKVLTETRLIGVQGEINRVALGRCVLLTGRGLTMKGGEWIDGTLIIDGTQNVRLSAQFFFGTAVSFTPEALQSNDTLFFGCDFSYAKMDKDTIKQVAARANDACVFSIKQLASLGEQGTKFQSQEKALNTVLSLAPGDTQSGFRSRGVLGIGRVPDEMQDDHRDDQRTDLEVAPTLKTAGLENLIAVRGEHVSRMKDARIFPALTAENKEQLPIRIAFFSRLESCVRSLGAQETVPVQEMLEFLIEEGDTLETLFGFKGSIRQLPQDLLHIPPKNRHKPGDDYMNRLSLEEATETGQVVNADQARRSTIKSRPIYYSRLQDLCAELADLAARLYNYGMYLVALRDKYGYEFPTTHEGEGYKLEEFAHPNLAAGPTLVRNAIELPAGNHILALSGANGRAGKTHFMDALALSIAQAQSGAPVPGKVEMPKDGLYDHVLIMPNLRNRTGSNESGMESRARVVLEEFLKKTKALAQEEPGAKPTKVFIGLDEIMMGVTRPDDAATIECNFLETLMEIQGLEVTIVLISPDDRVVHSLQRRFPDQLTILAPASDAELCRLIPAAKAAPCSPDRVLADRGLGEFLERKDWMVG